MLELVGRGRARGKKKSQEGRVELGGKKKKAKRVEVELDQKGKRKKKKGGRGTPKGKRVEGRAPEAKRNRQEGTGNHDFSVAHAN